MSTIGYIGVDGISRKIKTMYVGVYGLSKKVKTAYVGVNGVARKWMSGIDTSDPNTRYEDKYLGAWTRVSDVDAFCSAYNHANNYTGLSLGNYVQLNNRLWEIVGFDCEYNQTAADNTVYNNGYGILMAARPGGYTGVYHDSSGSISYINSYIHTTKLPTMATSLQYTLGSHMIQRNVLLGSAQNGTSPRQYTTSSYAWTTSYLTLMSAGQVTGTFARHNKKYDDGEANYKLPLYNYISTDSNQWWLRSIYGKDSVGITCLAYTVNTDFWIYGVRTTFDACGVRPLMLIR